IVRELRFPHSIGCFYSAITQFLGYVPDHDEWKVMGAAAYGDPGRYRSEMAGLLRYEADGEIELDLRYFDHFNFDSKSMLTRKAFEALGAPRTPSQPFEQRHFDLAAAAQAITEDYLAQAVNWLAQRSGVGALCLSGGVMMNSVFNGKIAASRRFDDVYLSYAPDDSGNSIGAALWAAADLGDPLPPQLPGGASPYLGPAYDDADILALLERYGLNARPLADVTGETAALLDAGAVVGWFQGRMEFGPRALGNRSILADPRRAEMKDRINAAVKYREAFRPFAPAVPLEVAADWFEMPPGTTVPYMEKVFLVLPHRRAAIPAVVHADGSGRLQTVDSRANPLFHQLLTVFGERTGVPILLNTSFNLNGEPIVASPTDAIRTFFTSGLDALVMGGLLLRKR
ncbi:MAG: carbamoyltransferase, partial [Proteobacteria bacterium]|nr:carbamoyltransferase [Pseudomonadota bacterium]